MTDSALLRSAAGGDADAMAKLIEAFAPGVYGYLAGMVGSEREAADGMQETFVRLARAVGRYETDTEPAPWIFSIARRVATDLRPTPAAAPGPPPADADPADWAKRALRALSVDHREALVCRQILGWDEATTAHNLNLTQADVAERLAEAKTKVADVMSGS